MFNGSGSEEPGRASRELWPAEWGYRAGMGFLGPEAIPEIAEGLVRLGYPANAVSGVLGENLMRVADAVWRSRLPASPPHDGQAHELTVGWPISGPNDPIS
jgi:hypothetical protein